MGNEQTERNADEQLVEMHRKARARKKRKLIITICVVVIALIVIVAVGVRVAKSRVDASVSSSASEIESADATIGSISTTISGSGTLTSTDVESIEIVSTVEIVDFYVETGDTVEEGDLIATVTSASLLSAMSDLQSQLDTLDASIEEAADETVDDEITAGASGRVKKIYVSSGDSVADVMYESGALMLLSLDGYMAVDIETAAVSAGESVTVTDSDGTAYDGTVESVTAGTAVVLISDKSAAYDDEVTVTDEDGNALGSGNLYIHSQIMVTGYAGTVSGISVSLNESVDSGDTLISLTDTDTSVSYDSLLKEREEVEEQLNNLITIYKEGGICATISGTIESLSGSSSDSAASALTSSDQSSTSSSYTTVAEISPDTQMEITISVDETDILSLEVGQEASVTIDSIGEDAYTGSVTEISTTATSSSGVTAYTAVVTIDKTEDMLAGMSATAVITIEGVENALLIPVDALHQTSSTSYVYTEYDEETGEFSGMVEVTTGLSNSSYVEITDGLSEGDTVYYTSSGDDETDFSSLFGNMGGGTTDNEIDSSMTMPDTSSGGGSDFSGGGMGGGSMPGQ